MTFTRMTTPLVVAIFVSIPARMWAQTDLSTIRGTASDPTGAVVANAKITVVNLETNIQRTTLTNDNGDFKAPDLKRGTYRLTAASAGFKTFVADNILLESGQIRRINVAFELGAVGTEVTVRADAAVISTDSAKISGGYAYQKYDATPMVGNLMEPTHMLTILPNVQSPMGGYGLRNFAFPNANISVPGLAGVIDTDYGDLTMEKAAHRRMEMRLRLDF